MPACPREHQRSAYQVEHKQRRQTVEQEVDRVVGDGAEACHGVDDRKLRADTGRPASAFEFGGPAVSQRGGQSWRMSGLLTMSPTSSKKNGTRSAGQNVTIVASAMTAAPTCTGSRAPGDQLATEGTGAAAAGMGLALGPRFFATVSIVSPHRMRYATMAACLPSDADLIIIRCVRTKRPTAPAFRWKSRPMRSLVDLADKDAVYAILDRPDPTSPAC
jgi:hypothetical protein